MICAPPFDGPFVPAAGDIDTMQQGMDELAATLGDATVVPLAVAMSPDAWRIRSSAGPPL
jgi:hypothetical protein